MKTPPPNPIKPLQPYQKTLLKRLLSLRPGEKLINATRRRKPQIVGCWIALILACATGLHAEDLWRGTLHLAGGRTLTGTIEDVTATSIKFISKGDLYWFKIADLPAATRGELDIGVTTIQATPADKAAYLADLPRRRALVQAERDKAQAAQDRIKLAAEVERRIQAREQAQRDQKQQELEAFRKREEARRQTEALEQIALELQLRRLNSGK